MFNIDISGLDKLQNDLRDAQGALESLNGTITTLKFDRSDPESGENPVLHRDGILQFIKEAFPESLVPLGEGRGSGSDRLQIGELNSGKYCLAIDAETLQKP